MVKGTSESANQGVFIAMFAKSGSAKAGLEWKGLRYKHGLLAISVGANRLLPNNAHVTLTPLTLPTKERILSSVSC